MTRAALLVAWHEYVTNVRRPAFLIATLLAPFGAMVLVALVVSLTFPTLERFVAAQGLPVGVVDASGRLVPVPEEFADRYTAFDDVDSARAALLDGRVSGYVVTADDFASTGEVEAFQRRDLRLQLNGLAPVHLRPFLVRGLLHGRIEPETIRVVQSRELGEVFPTAVDEAGRPLPETAHLAEQVARIALPFAIATLLAMTIFGASNYLLRSITEEKENRVLEMVMCAVTPVDLLAGKVMGLGALSLTQVAVWPAYGSLPLLAGFGPVSWDTVGVLDPGMIALSLVYFALGYVQYAVLMAAAGSLGTNMRESQQIGAQFALLAVVPFLVAPFMIVEPNLPAVRALSLIPLFAPTMMMMRLPFGEVPPGDIAASLVVTAVSIPVVIWASARVFRASLLVYGKRLTVREIVAALRHD